MSQLVPILEEVRKLRAEAVHWQGRANAASSEARAMIALLKERIQKGKTTESRVLDFMIVAYGLIDGPLCEAYLNLEQRLKDREGQMVIVAYESRTRTRFGGPGDVRSSDYETSPAVECGVLRASQLVVDLATGSCSLPTGGHLSLRGMFLSEETIGHKTGNILLKSGAGITATLIDRMVETSAMLGGMLPGIKAAELFIGDEECSKWFEKHNPDMLLHCKMQLGIGDMLVVPG